MLFLLFFFIAYTNFLSEMMGIVISLPYSRRKCMSKHRGDSFKSNPKMRQEDICCFSCCCNNKVKVFIWWQTRKYFEDKKICMKMRSERAFSLVSLFFGEDTFCVSSKSKLGYILWKSTFIAFNRFALSKNVPFRALIRWSCNIGLFRLLTSNWLTLQWKIQVDFTFSSKSLDSTQCKSATNI